jgi:hypothetical protein
MKVSPIVRWKNKLNNPIRMNAGPINNVSAATEERAGQAGTDEVEKEEQSSAK